MTPALFFLVLSIGLFCWLLVTKLELRLEKDKNDVLEMEITSMEHHATMLKNKIQKKKEVLTTQDLIIKEQNEIISRYNETH
jgi:septum formation inhibitor MinC